MAILTGVLRVLSDFGDAAGWLIAALVLFAYGRRIIAENEKAHKELTKNVQENQQRITALDAKVDTVAKDLDTKIDTVAKDLDTKIDTVAKDLDTKIDTVAKDLDAKIDTVAKGLDAWINTVAQTLAAVAKDVSFLAGRQAERDRVAEG